MVPVNGTALENMVLMLNDKVDKLSDEVRSLRRYLHSPESAIPWASNRVPDHTPRHGGNTIYGHIVDEPQCVAEWSRRGWDVWRVTVPAFPDTPPYYTIVQKGAPLPAVEMHFDPHSDDPYNRFRDTPIVHELVE